MTRDAQHTTEIPQPPPGNAVTAKPVLLANLGGADWEKLAILDRVLCGCPLALMVLYTYPPEDFAYYPKCWLYVLTGLHCPGCGATRAVFALLHGDWEQALAYNALFVLLLPLARLRLAVPTFTAALVFDVPFRPKSLVSARANGCGNHLRGVRYPAQHRLLASNSAGSAQTLSHGLSRTHPTDFCR